MTYSKPKSYASRPLQVNSGLQIYTNLQRIWECDTETYVLFLLLSCLSGGWWADFWDQDVCLQKRELLASLQNPGLKLMSPSAWENGLPTRSHNGSQWFLTLHIHFSSLPILLEAALWFHLLTRTNSRIWFQVNEWGWKKQKRSGDEVLYTVAATFQVWK